MDINSTPDTNSQDMTPATYRIHLDETVLNLTDAQPTGGFLLQKAGKDSQTHFLVQIIPEMDDIIVEADDTVDLTQAGVEKFIVVVKGKQFMLFIDEGRHRISVPDPTGRDLLQLAGKDISEYALVQIIPNGDDQFISLDEKVNLRPVGIERFITVVKDEGCERPQITIQVNKKPVTFIVPQSTGRQIKEQAIAQGVSIKLDFPLFEVTADAMEAIGDADIVKLACGQVFLATAPDDNS
jgi:hypothetical protein